MYAGSIEVTIWLRNVGPLNYFHCCCCWWCRKPKLNVFFICAFLASTSSLLSSSTTTKNQIPLLHASAANQEASQPIIMFRCCFSGTFCILKSCFVVVIVMLIQCIHMFEPSSNSGNSCWGIGSCCGPSPAISQDQQQHQNEKNEFHKQNKTENEKEKNKN